MKISVNDIGHIPTNKRAGFYFSLAIFTSSIYIRNDLNLKSNSLYALRHFLFLVYT